MKKEEFEETEACGNYHFQKKELREELAELEHEQWAHWTTYLFGRLSLKPNSLKVDKKTKKDFERWVSQTITPYNSLSKKEKDSDRIWADKVLKIFKEHTQNTQRRIKEIEYNIDIEEWEILMKKIDKIFLEEFGRKLI